MTLSLRARVILGSVCWTIGLVLLTFTLMSLVFQHAPDMPFLGRRAAIHFVWTEHAVLILVGAVLAMAAGAFQVRRGVSRAVDDLNALLAHREEAARRAVAKAGDLAHGLKTPLALIAREAELATAAGDTGLASAITQQVDRMRRQIDYHLAHARAAASGNTSGASCSIRESADGLARTLLRLYADRTLSIDVRVDPSHVARVQREDLDEMLGNLLDNACKWTRARIVIASADAGDAVVVTVDDDGPGLAREMRDAVLVRGVRADEQASGSGLGLAIVRDLAELYHGSIALHDSPLGGLRSSLSLPKWR
ncbi:MAG: sensor histidine kinase [Acidimicrobiia bacterium]|nr:sensor histidine kinase [Acidimicrobiia bacterium]